MYLYFLFQSCFNSWFPFRTVGLRRRDPNYWLVFYLRRHFNTGRFTLAFPDFKKHFAPDQTGAIITDVRDLRP